MGVSNHNKICFGDNHRIEIVKYDNEFAIDVNFEGSIGEYYVDETISVSDIKYCPYCGEKLVNE